MDGDVTVLYIYYSTTHLLTLNERISRYLFSIAEPSAIGVAASQQKANRRRNKFVLFWGYFREISLFVVNPTVFSIQLIV